MGGQRPCPKARPRACATSATASATSTAWRSAVLAPPTAPMAVAH